MEGGGGLQSMGLTGEPAAAATFSSAGHVCVWCLTLCVCVCVCAQACVSVVCVTLCTCVCARTRACEEVSVQVSV